MSDGFGISTEIFLKYSYTTHYNAVVASSFVNQMGVFLGSTPVKMKTVIKWVMYHCTHKHSYYHDGKGFHYLCFELVCPTSACAITSALMLGFSNGWSICHDMGLVFLICPVTSGDLGESDALSELVAVVYLHSVAFEGFKAVCLIGPLNDRSGTESQIMFYMWN